MRFGSLCVWLILCVLACAVPVRSETVGISAPSLSEMVAHLLPAVVNIETSQVGDPTETNRAGLTQTGPKRTLGSGFIIDPSGLIVTNKHVVEGAARLTVVLQDNSIFKAKVIGRGVKSDIALLSISSMTPLPFVSFGDSDKLRPGDPVLAIGNPLGLGGTVSSGIVSALNRDLHDSFVSDFIQTDAAINHGNSGGPLFDLSGKVVGVNTAIFTTGTGGGSIGLGFAIPSNDVEFVVGQLKQYGRIHAGWLGIELQKLDPGLVDAAGLKGPAAAIVADVTPGGPGAEAGIEAGDIILRYAGHAAGGATSFILAVAAMPIGAVIPIVIWRDGHEVTVNVTTREWPDEKRPIGEGLSSVAASVPSEPLEFGLQLSPLTDEIRQRYGSSHYQKGVVVVGIDPSSWAATIDISLGEVIRKVQSSEVNSPDEVTDKLLQTRKLGRSYAQILLEGPVGLRWLSLPLVP